MAKQISEAAHSAKNKITMTPGDRVLNLRDTHQIDHPPPIEIL